MTTRPNGIDEIIRRYGEPWKNQYELAVFEERHMTLWRANFLEVAASIDLTSLPCRHIYMNREMVAPWNIALVALAHKGIVGEIKSFGGCWNVRKIRGRDDAWSIHTWGLALDFNAESMPLGMLSSWSPAFVRTMNESGFVWGGDFERIDAMHFQFAENC